jgi:two-component system cell cycle response regulator
MTARVLVVDDKPVNVRLLEAKLMTEYYDVITATSGREALERVKSDRPDLILLDIMMPVMDGFQVCEALKADPATAHIPVVMVTALNEPADRVRGLEAGADDFLSKPVNDMALLARVKSLLRLKMLLDELRLREETSIELGVVSNGAPDDGVPGDLRTLVVEDDPDDAELIRSVFAEGGTVDIVPDVDAALAKAFGGGYDMVVVSLLAPGADPLRLCSQLRSHDQTRHSSILVMIGEDDTERLAKALDLGVNDYLMKPIDQSELRARVRTQIHYKSYQDQLREAYDKSVAMALTDDLTGLYNHRYLTKHLDKLHGSDAGNGRGALLMLDLDHFKEVNDNLGHLVGDEVLAEVGRRLKGMIRGRDLAARVGGEEFVVVLSNADAGKADNVAERLREGIAKEPMAVSAPIGSLNMTVSVGVAMYHGADEKPDDQLKRADKALYEAKRAGRDRVVIAA